MVALASRTSGSCRARSMIGMIRSGNGVALQVISHSHGSDLEGSRLTCLRVSLK